MEFFTAVFLSTFCDILYPPNNEKLFNVSQKKPCAPAVTSVAITAPIYIDATKEECIQRIGERPIEFINYINKWWEDVERGIIL